MGSLPPFSQGQDLSVTYKPVALGSSKNAWPSSVSKRIIPLRPPCHLGKQKREFTRRRGGVAPVEAGIFSSQQQGVGIKLPHAEHLRVLRASARTQALFFIRVSARKCRWALTPSVRATGRIPDHVQHDGRHDMVVHHHPDDAAAGPLEIGPPLTASPLSYPDRVRSHQMSSSASGPVIISSATFSVRWRIAFSRRSAMSGCSRR